MLRREAAHHFGRRAHDHRAVGELFAFSHQRACAHQAVFANFCAVEHDGAYANERLVANRAAVQHHLVAHGHVLAHAQVLANVGVQDAAVLDVAALTDVNALGVATNDYAKPDAGVRRQVHPAHNLRAVGHPSGLGDGGGNLL